jgi:hypothetical protein
VSLKSAQDELEGVLKKHNVSLQYEVVFPMYKRLPDEVQLALKVLMRHGMTIRFLLKDKK